MYYDTRISYNRVFRIAALHVFFSPDKQLQTFVAVFFLLRHSDISVIARTGGINGQTILHQESIDQCTSHPGTVAYLQTGRHAMGNTQPFIILLP